MFCDSPLSMMVDGREVIGVCRSCAQCRAVRKRDVIGRALAENRHAAGGTCVTLTYGRDPRISANQHPHAKKLHYQDFQKFIKRIRARQIPGTTEKYKVRYMVAGEYGSLKGRAHWHCVLWWYNSVPEYSTVERWSEDPFWQEGFTQWQKINPSGISYVAKYITKDGVNDDTETVFHASFRPLIGAHFFKQWAELHVDQRLPLRQGRKYQIGGSYSKKTKRLFDYFMTEAAARYVARCYVEAWERKYPGVHWPYSRIVEKYLDGEARPRLEKIRDDAAIERVRVGGRLSEARKRALLPSEGPPRGYESWWDDSLMVFVAVTGDGRPELFWNDKASRWSRRVQPRKPGLADISTPMLGENDPLPDLPGEPPREFRRVVDVPEYEPGEALDLSKRRTKPGSREAYASRKAREYHRQMVTGRMERVAEAIKRFREDDASS